MIIVRRRADTSKPNLLREPSEPATMGDTEYCFVSTESNDVRPTSPAEQHRTLSATAHGSESNVHPTELPYYAAYDRQPESASDR